MKRTLDSSIVGLGIGNWELVMGMGMGMGIGFNGSFGVLERVEAVFTC